MPHQHGVFTGPKRIRPFFKFDRSNMSMLYQAAWRAWQECVTQQCPDGTSGAVMALHSAGDLIAFHPHIHAFLLSGALRADGSFAPLEIDADTVREHFERGVLDALVAKGLLTPEIVDSMRQWPHSGFSVYLGEPILGVRCCRLQDAHENKAGRRRKIKGQ